MKLPDYLQCDLCAAGETFSAQTLQAMVNSSERAFEQERFTVWQCRHCGCLHAKEGVDLDYYYSRYELHDQELDLLTRYFYHNKLAWLRQAGIGPNAHILDYGCGSGAFIQYLQENGFAQVFGYDPFTQKFANTEVLQQSYDLVMSSDVIEHDTAPRQHLQTLARLTNSQGMVYLQTPNARGIAVAKGNHHRQVLQQPYHRHILSDRWVVEQMQTHGCQVVQSLPTPYFHSRIPFLNLRAIDFYCNRYGGLVALNEPWHAGILLSPSFWLWGMIGGLFPLQDEMQMLFQKG